MTSLESVVDQIYSSGPADRENKKIKRKNRESDFNYQLDWTDSNDQLLSFGNGRVIHSLHYGLREREPEEEEAL